MLLLRLRIGLLVVCECRLIAGALDACFTFVGLPCGGDLVLNSDVAHFYGI